MVDEGHHHYLSSQQQNNAAADDGASPDPFTGHNVVTHNHYNAAFGSPSPLEYWHC